MMFLLGEEYVNKFCYSVKLQKMAEAKGCHQCLWLLGEDDEITEVGAMNIFVMLKKENSNDLELVTPPLDTGVILPGITRRSVIELTKDWDEFEVNERKLTMGEVSFGMSKYLIIF